MEAKSSGVVSLVPQPAAVRDELNKLNDQVKLTRRLLRFAEQTHGIAYLRTPPATTTQREGVAGGR